MTERSFLKCCWRSEVAKFDTIVLTLHSSWILVLSQDHILHILLFSIQAASNVFWSELPANRTFPKQFPFTAFGWFCVTSYLAREVTIVRVQRVEPKPDFTDCMWKPVLQPEMLNTCSLLGRWKNTQSALEVSRFHITWNNNNNHNNEEITH